MRVVLKSNYRVVVFPKTSYYGIQCCDEKDEADLCARIAEQARRHIDNVHSASVEFDQSPVCSHCGSKWTEDGEAYNGGCCSKDQEAEDAKTKQSKPENT